MTTLQKLRLTFETDLRNAKDRRLNAIQDMRIADSLITAAGDALDRIDREIRAEKEPNKA